MNGKSFIIAYLLCRSLVREPGYIDAMTDPSTYADKSEETLEASLTTEK